MKNFVLIPNITKDKGLSVTKNITKKLISLGGAVYISEKYREYSIDGASFFETAPENTELIVVVGGDGSMLDASTLAIERDIPLLGVNLGKVGYLSEVEPNNLDVLSHIFKGEYEIEEKMLLSVAILKDGERIEAQRLAVNDVILSHDSFLGIAEFVLYNALGDSIKYRADGMILSTPAGSTAYSLSAGGPIISHNIDAIVATPICPHSFFNRSIVFQPNDVIKLKNKSKSPLNISIDGRLFCDLASGELCEVKTAERRLRVLTFSESNMFSTLFKKMKILEEI